MPTDVRQLIDKTIKLIHSEIPADVNIDVETPDAITAQLDARRMSQALINLMMNGIQAMEGGGGRLSVRTDLNGDGHQFTIEVADEGAGIDPKVVPRIFDPFFSTKEVDRGTGLGLYVTYGIIKKHNGDISVSSESGAGTKFVITLPVEQPSES
jgi:signal transduction histidine kinase